MSQPLSSIDVLLIDDDPDGREMCEFALSSYGATVRTAGSAEEGLVALSQARPSVLVCDITLPDQDGYAFLPRARALWPDLPAIAMTGHAARADVQRAHDAGYQLHLSKPIDIDKLVAAVRELGG